MTEILKSKRQLRRENRDLRADALQRDRREAILAVQYAKTDTDLAKLQELYGAMTRTVGTIDSSEVKALKKVTAGLEGQVAALTRQLAAVPDASALHERIAELIAEVADLASKLEAATAAISVKYDGSEWATGDDSDSVKLRRAREHAAALETRLADLQRATERADTHRSQRPWIDEQDRHDRQQRTVTS